MMLTPAERAAKRAAWLIRIRAEINRRQAQAFGAVVGDPRKDLLDQLAEIGGRLRSWPGHVPLTAAQERQVGQRLDRWFKRRGYGTGE